ncbi:hypothetical protein SteCoe_37997 [Stentor coeruleus]|uniref:Uncharacterized protein n=1 Tax=Stentor coeruleus TaxID=5963 RepID=A0A1R2AM08_9CILI|nr:hypothetical protein SteCoe_37997 [Stentor coeruleus]
MKLPLLNYQQSQVNIYQCPIIEKKSPFKSQKSMFNKELTDLSAENYSLKKNTYTNRKTDGLMFFKSNFKVNCIVAFKKRNCMVIAGMDCEIIIYDYETNKKVASVLGHNKGILCLDLDCTEEFLMSGSLDHSIRISNLSEKNPSSYEIGRHKGAVNCLKVDWVRKKVVSWGKDFSICIWDITTKALEAELFLDQQEYSSLVFFSPTKIFASSVSGNIHSYCLDLETNSIQKSEEIISTKHKKTINCILFFNNTKRIASGSSDKTIRIVNLEDNCEILSLTGHKSPIISMAISNDDIYLISGDQWGKTNIWNLNTIKLIKVIDDHQGFITSIVLDYEKKILIIGGADFCCGVWDFKKLIM